jgi:hypothetical protein
LCLPLRPALPRRNSEQSLRSVVIFLGILGVTTDFQIGRDNLSRDDPVRPGSNRSFGFTMAAADLLIAAWPLIHGNSPRHWLMILALGLAGAAQFRPNLLAPLNKGWFKLGLILHRVTNPVIMAALFYGVLTPIAAVFRLMRRDPLGLRYDRSIASYWVTHPAAEGRPSDMRKQF